MMIDLRRFTQLRFKFSQLILRDGKYEAMAQYGGMVQYDCEGWKVWGYGTGWLWRMGSMGVWHSMIVRDGKYEGMAQNNTVYFQRRQELGSRDLPSTKLLRLLLPRSHHRMPPPHHLEAWYVVRVSVMVYNKDFNHGIWWGLHPWYMIRISFIVCDKGFIHGMWWGFHS